MAFPNLLISYALFRINLSSSETELRALFAAMDDAVLVRDCQGKCLKIAPTKRSNLYGSPEAMIGKTLHETLPRSQADTILNYIRQTLQTQQTIQGEYELTIDQRKIVFASSFSPISEDAVLIVARDISDRRQAERSKDEFLSTVSHEIRTPTR